MNKEMQKMNDITGLENINELYESSLLKKWIKLISVDTTLTTDQNTGAKNVLIPSGTIWNISTNTSVLCNLINLGTINVQSGGRFYASGTGQINNNSGGIITQSGGSFFAQDTGQINNNSGGIITQSGGFFSAQNNGAINNNSGGSITQSGGSFRADDTGIINNSGSITQSGGDFYAENNGQINNNTGGSIILLSGGSLTSSGIIVSNQNTNSGIIYYVTGRDPTTFLGDVANKVLVEIFGKETKITAQTYHAYESTFLEDYKKNYKDYPILCDNCDPEYKE